MAENELTMEDRRKLAKDFYETTSYDKPPTDDFMELSDPDKEPDDDSDLYEDGDEKAEKPERPMKNAEESPGVAAVQEFLRLTHQPPISNEEAQELSDMIDSDFKIGFGSRRGMPPLAEEPPAEKENAEVVPESPGEQTGPLNESEAEKGSG